MNVHRLLLPVLSALLASLACMPPRAHAQSEPGALDVLHWWTSASERRAADQLGELLLPVGVQWNDAAIPGGGGMAAVKVLKSRVLMGDPPDVAQLIGSTLTEWADMGMVLPLNAVAKQHKWQGTIFPVVMDLVTYKGNVIAAPLGIHRINNLLYNRRLFAKHGLQPPRTWEELEIAAKRFRQSGIKPIAWSDEAWQVATVFESVLLGEAGPALYHELMVLRKRSAWMDPRVALALQRLRWLRALNGDVPSERSWTTATREVMGDTSAMMIMGDWAYGELLAWGASPRTDVGCVVVPGTQNMHLYSVDTLAMLVNARNRVALQEKMASTLVGMSAQVAFNRVKGAVPVRRDLSSATLQAMEGCARSSWETFASPSATRVPSLAHRMVADEAAKDAVAQALWRYVTSPPSDTLDTQRRLASAIQAP